MAAELTATEPREILELCAQAMSAPTFEEVMPAVRTLFAVGPDRCSLDIGSAVGGAWFKAKGRGTPWARPAKAGYVDL